MMRKRSMSQRSPESAEHWAGARALVLARDRNTCQGCGCQCAGHEADVHHLIPRAGGGRDEPANLITLCDGCHAASPWPTTLPCTTVGGDSGCAAGRVAPAGECDRLREISVLSDTRLTEPGIGHRHLPTKGADEPTSSRPPAEENPEHVHQRRSRTV